MCFDFGYWDIFRSRLFFTQNTKKNFSRELSESDKLLIILFKNANRWKLAVKLNGLCWRFYVRSLLSCSWNAHFIEARKHSARNFCGSFDSGEIFLQFRFNDNIHFNLKHERKKIKVPENGNGTRSCKDLKTLRFKFLQFSLA